MTPEEARERMRRKKAHKTPMGLEKRIFRQQAKADRRARYYLDRWLEGESMTAIARSFGLHHTTIRNAIERYRQRHPDAKIPKRKTPDKYLQSKVATADESV